MFGLLDNKKTYLTGIGMLLASVGGYLKGAIDLQTAIMGALNGFAFIFMRKAIAAKGL